MTTNLQLEPERLPPHEPSTVNVPAAGRAPGRSQAGPRPLGGPADVPVGRGAAMNPLLQPWDTPFGLPPFTQVRAEHFKPAFAQALTEHRAELDAIGAQTA